MNLRRRFSESRMREIHPSGLMRGRECSGDTDNFGRFNHLNSSLCLLYLFSGASEYRYPQPGLFSAPSSLGRRNRLSANSYFIEPMKPPSTRRQLTIGQIIAFGFAVVLLITAFSGAFVVRSLGVSAKEFHVTAAERRPHAKNIQTLQRIIGAHNVMHSIHGFIGQPVYYEKLTKTFDEVEAALKETTQFIAQHPTLAPMPHQTARTALSC
jgi:hypothetical protein